MKAVVIMLDSVNRHFMGAYGEKLAETPNLDRLQEKSVVFDNHWAGSLPCMPARRDMLTGRLHFLERNWGPVEPFDVTLPQVLREGGVFSHIATDHYHYFRIGGENYCQQFSTWDFIRGQEVDPWVSRVEPPQLPKGVGKCQAQYELNRTRFQSEEDFSSPKTIRAAIDWLADNANKDQFLLWVEAFDPHEPFDLPEEELEAYGDDYNGLPYIWPEYGKVNVPEPALKHIRNRYKALLTMTDRWVGKLLDALDRHEMWQDTMIIFTTDHGYMLGEHDFMAKNYMPVYNEIAHIPLMVHLPGGQHAGKRVGALTQNIDLFPTLLDHFGIDPGKSRNKLHGHSLLPLIKGDTDRIREYALYGYFGKNVNITDGRFTYFRAAVRNENEPIYLYTAMPTTIGHYYGNNYIVDPAKIEAGRFLKWTEYPVFKIPASNINMNDQTQNFNLPGEYILENLLFDLQEDAAQQRPIHDQALERKFMDHMRTALIEHDSPEEQFDRLGL